MLYARFKEQDDPDLDNSQNGLPAQSRLINPSKHRYERNSYILFTDVTCDNDVREQVLNSAPDGA